MLEHKRIKLGNLQNFSIQTVISTLNHGIFNKPFNHVSFFSSATQSDFFLNFILMPGAGTLFHFLVLQPVLYLTSNITCILNLSNSQAVHSP